PTVGHHEYVDEKLPDKQAGSHLLGGYSSGWDLLQPVIVCASYGRGRAVVGDGY
ncbi:Transposable element Tcb1 transposase, partial [Araneus ventricosus]